MPHAVLLYIVIFMNVTWTLTKDLLYEEINTHNRYHSRREMLFTVKAGNDSLHGMFQAFTLGGNYVLLFAIFRLFWDT